MKEFIEALRNEKSYSWICEHGHELSKCELIDIIKEFDYGIHSGAIFETEKDDIFESVADELEELYPDEEE
jgi:hypothetical protein